MTMTILVTDTGFQADDWIHGFVPLAAASPHSGCAGTPLAIDLGNPACTPEDWARLKRFLPRTALVRIRLRHIGDTAGFDLATSMRRAGFDGRIRAHGAVLAAHYTLARRAGFTEIELQPHQAQRQPCEHWHNDTGWSPARRTPLSGPRGDGASRGRGTP
ncbi:MAG: hypothetical protein HLUCCA12_10385 [Rhodobacteraceae bacterium HLUCCA12]|nr:MAG: hypothetical protein HLUCCA12_10385 [Rhodobacteraceae bacterium HLUCCA12]